MAKSQLPVGAREPIGSIKPRQHKLHFAIYQQFLLRDLVSSAAIWPVLQRIVSQYPEFLEEFSAVIAAAPLDRPNSAVMKSPNTPGC